jgi:two-component system, NtrC family, sensor kinase
MSSSAGGAGASVTPSSPMAGFELVRALVEDTGDVLRFKPDEIPRGVLDEIVTAATRRYPDRFPEPPWQFVVVVGEERERLVAVVAEALGRHWGLSTGRPRGLASEGVLQAPALVLVFSRVPSSEGLDAIAQVAFGVQNFLLLAAAHGLATARTFGPSLVPEAVLDFVASRLGSSYRDGELVAMLAIGYPAEPPTPSGQGVKPAWIGGDGCAPAPDPSEPPDAPAMPPAPVLRSAGRERVLVVDPYQYNRDDVRRLLDAAGYQVETFADGQALLGRIAGGPGDPAHLYLVSDSLPDTSAFELVRALRARQATVPLIVATARRDSAFRIGGLAAGADYYLRKPVNPIELYTAVRILIERQRRGEELARANQELSRLLAELRAAQERLVMQAKLASLGQLVAGVAHEINTPLGAVVSNNDLFLRCFTRLRQRVEELGLAADAAVLRDLRAVEDLAEVTRTATNRITGIVRELRTFARLDEADRKAVDVHEGIESTLVLIAHLTKGRIEVRRQYGKLPAVECHPNQLNQVFMNLLVNACHAIEGTGTITIQTWHEPHRHQVHVAVSDDGKGISREHLARIFDPGFTTKGAGVGTGLGLAICYQIVEAHGGRIGVESVPGKGTTFVVSLPVPGDAAAAVTR